MPAMLRLAVESTQFLPFGLHFRKQACNGLEDTMRVCPAKVEVESLSLVVVGRLPPSCQPTVGVAPTQRPPFGDPAAFPKDESRPSVAGRPARPCSLLNNFFKRRHVKSGLATCRIKPRQGVSACAPGGGFLLLSGPRALNPARPRMVSQVRGEVKRRDEK